MEIVIYVAIMGMVMSALILFAISIGNNRDKAYSASEVTANSQLVLNQLEVLIHRARSIDSARSVFDSDQGVLTLFLGPNQTLPAVIRLSNGRVQILLEPDPAYFLSSQAVSFPRLKFSKLSETQIGLEMITAYGPLGGQLTPEKAFVQNIKTTINLR